MHREPKDILSENINLRYSNTSGNGKRSVISTKDTKPLHLRSKSEQFNKTYYNKDNGNEGT